ncbi:hypothetical protein TWF569_002211 [Orbilia oligospora]|nr:hypothetical protein TWF569_002211 [Orbilia oligospora]
MSSPNFPSSVLRSNAILKEIAKEPQYESYKEFLDAAEGTFSDIKWARQDFENDFYRHKTGMKHSRGAVYAVDIIESDPHTHTVVSSEPQTTSAGVEKLLSNAAPMTKMRIVIFDHGKVYDKTLVGEIAGFYDINPRNLRDHFFQHQSETVISNLNLEVRNTYPGYLPSESRFSPLQLERTILTRPKKTTFLIPNKKAEYPTVIVFIWSPLKRYSTNVVNRDLITPSQMIPRHCLSSSYQPSNDAETFLLRLFHYTNFELEACISQPILVVQPFLRTYLLEISQDIKQIRDHVAVKGLNEIMEDREFSDWDEAGSNWGTPKDMPFRAFQKLNDSFVGSVRSIQDHMSTPWVNHLKPNMEFAHAAAETIMKDVARIQDQMKDLRTKVNDLSAYSAAQESINEARKSVAQAESVTQLTRLAFIYIPLTYATSLFGINISEWQDETMPSGKWFIMTSVICTLITIASALLLARGSNFIQRHGGLVSAIWYGFKKCLVMGIFYTLVTFPRFVSDKLSDFFASFRRKEKAMV